MARNAGQTEQMFFSLLYIGASLPYAIYSQLKEV